MDEDLTPFRPGDWREPLGVDAAIAGVRHCGECGAQVTSITRGHQVKDGKVGPMEPARFGCGHLAGKLGTLVQMDLSASAPDPGAYWPELPDGLVAIAGKYDRTNRWRRGSIMGATQVTRPPAEPVVRAGVFDVDTAMLATIRAYVLAADESYQAKTKLEVLRAMLDVMAGDRQELTYGGAAVLTFEDQLKRSVDVDRLAARWPEAYADVVTATDTYRLSIGAEVRRLLRKRTWRAAMARRAGR